MKELLGNVIGGAFGIGGSALNAKAQRDMNKENLQSAKEFAQNSMQWKANDLRKAGINPLYAMGAGGYSAPVGVAPQYDVSSFEKMGKGIGAIPQFAKEQRLLAKAQASKIQSEANVNNAKARKLDQDTVVGAGGKFFEASPLAGKIFTYDPRTGWNTVTDSQHLTEAKENDWILWLTDMLTTLKGVDQSYEDTMTKRLIANGEYNPDKDWLDIDHFGNYKVYYGMKQNPKKTSIGYQHRELNREIKKAYGRMKKAMPKKGKVEWLLKQMGF